MSSANVARHLREAARRTPDAPAIIAPDGRGGHETLTFAELDRLTDAGVARLRSRGFRPGMRTLLMVKPGLDLILCAFALFKLGAPPVAIDPGMGLKNFLSCVERTEPDALLGVPAARAVAAVFRRKFRTVRVRATVTAPGFRAALAREAARLPAGGIPVREVAPGDLAAILFTSGSTGAPKGVRYEHGMFEAQLALIRDAYDIRPGEVDLPMLPVFALFNPAFGMTTVAPEMNPAKPASFDPDKIIRAILDHGVTTGFGSPALWRKIADRALASGLTLPSVRRVLCAGAPVPVALHRDLRRVLPNGVVHTPYGATECLPVCSIAGPEVLEETHAITSAGGGTCVGRPLPGVRVAIMPVRDGVVPDLADNPPFAAPGPVGEIIVRSPACTRAYDRNPEATALAKIADRADGGFWHRMGDMGRLDDAGRLWFLGRKAERILSAAGPLCTEPAEATFNTHPDVARCALFGLGAPGAQTPALVVEPLPEKFPRSAAARAAFESSLRELASRHEHTAAVKRFFFEKRLPTDVRHNAKIHRLSLKKKYDRVLTRRFP